MGAQDLFNLDLEQAGFFVIRKPYAHTLGAIACGPGWREPRDFACHGVALDVVGKRQQNIDVIAQLVLAGGGDDTPPSLKRGM